MDLRPDCCNSRYCTYMCIYVLYMYICIKYHKLYPKKELTKSAQKIQEDRKTLKNNQNTFSKKKKKVTKHHAPESPLKNQ